MMSKTPSHFVLLVCQTAIPKSRKPSTKLRMVTKKNIPNNPCNNGPFISSRLGASFANTGSIMAAKYTINISPDIPAKDNKNPTSPSFPT